MKKTQKNQKLRQRDGRKKEEDEGGVGIPLINAKRIIEKR
jgi:hypothetical protein